MNTVGALVLIGGVGLGAWVLLAPRSQRTSIWQMTPTQIGAVLSWL